MGDYYFDYEGNLVKKQKKTLVTRRFDDGTEYQVLLTDEQIQEEEALRNKQEQSEKHEWIKNYKFLRDLRKKGTDSYDIYKEWKENNK